MARQAMLLDLKAGTVLRLRQSRIAAVIGLSKSEELLCTTGEETEQPEIVLELCRIKYKADGHWLIPAPNLPTTVNDNIIKGHVLLQNGSVIRVGDRYMRYSFSSPSISNTSSQPFGSSQAFGAITNLDSICSQSSNKFLTASTTFDPSTVYASLRSLSNKTSTTQDDEAISGLDPELLQFLQTNDGLAHMTAAIVSQHVFVYTSLKLTAAEIDSLFLSFEHVTAWEDLCFNTFLCEYEQLFATQTEAAPETESNYLDQHGTACIHSPVLHLLTSLLKVTLDPVKYNVLWLRILAALTKCSKSLKPLIQYKTAGAVLGCMAAKSDLAQIQEHGCYILAQIANYKPPSGETAPLKEGAVQIVLDALKAHRSVSKVRRNAVRFLENITQTYARLAMDVVNSLGFVSLEEQRDSLVSVMRMLNFVEEEALPVFRELESVFAKDEHCQARIKKIISYFQDSPHETKNGCREMNDTDLLQSEGEKEDHLQVEKHFNETQDISDAIARVNGHSIAKDGECSGRRQNEDTPKHDTTDGNSVENKNQTQSNDVTSPDSQELSTSTYRSRSEVNRSKDGVAAIPGKSKPGMLAFAVRTSKKDKENRTPNKTSEDSFLSSEGTTRPPSLGESIISGVEFFSDEEDSSRSINDTKNIKNKKTTKESPDRKKQANSDKSVSFDRVSCCHSEEQTKCSSDLLLEGIHPQKEKVFVSETALSEGSVLKPNRNASYSNVARKKRSTLLDKLTRRNSKPKKRCSILCTEYTQKPSEKDNVQLNSSSLLYGFIERPLDCRGNTAEVNERPNGESPPARTSDSTPQSGPGHENDANDRPSTEFGLDSVDSAESFDLGVNVFRYVNIFCNMSRDKKFKDTASIASSTDSAEHKKLKAGASPQSAAEFLKRTRKLFREGRGRYDIAEAAIRASFRHNDVSGLSYIPLTLEEHGHDCDLRDSFTTRQETN